MISEKKKVRIEYPLNPASNAVLWNAISTPAGLERWFADKVTKSGKTYTFCWGKTECREADMVNTRNEHFIRFHWKDDDEPKSFFELKILYDELTCDRLLEVTDFAGPDDEDDVVSLWDSQIDVLRRVCGI